MWPSHVSSNVLILATIVLISKDCFNVLWLFLFYNILLLFHGCLIFAYLFKDVNYGLSELLFCSFNYFPFSEFLFLNFILGLYILCWGMSPNVSWPLVRSSYLRRIRHQSADRKFCVHNLPCQLVGFTTEQMFLFSFFRENFTISCKYGCIFHWAIWVCAVSDNAPYTPPNPWAADNYRSKPLWLNFSREYTYFPLLV